MLAAAMLSLFTGCAKESLFGVESPNASYWKGYWHDARDGLSRPARWEKRDWLTLAGLAAGTLAIHSQDAEIRDSILDSRSDFSESLACFGEKTGSLLVLPAGLALGYGLGCGFDDPKLKEASLLGLEGLVLSALATRGLKYLVGRERPYVGGDADQSQGPTFDEDYTSWPSGHTTIAFAVATAFHLEYRRKWVSVLAYTLTAIGGWSRIHEDMHWASDVFAGATVGIVTTRAIFRARGERSPVLAKRWRW